jgi:hypothetical protein
VSCLLRAWLFSSLKSERSAPVPVDLIIIGLQCSELADLLRRAMMPRPECQGPYSAIRRRTDMAARLRTAINAGRPYAINNRLIENFG